MDGHHAKYAVLTDERHAYSCNEHLEPLINVMIDGEPRVTVVQILAEATCYKEGNSVTAQ